MYLLLYTEFKGICMTRMGLNFHFETPEVRQVNSFLCYQFIILATERIQDLSLASAKLDLVFPLNRILSPLIICCSSWLCLLMF